MRKAGSFEAGAGPDTMSRASRGCAANIGPGTGGYTRVLPAPADNNE